MSVTYGDDVFLELVDLSAYLAQDDEEIAHRFLNACDLTFRFLADNRHVGSLRRFERAELSDVRMWRVKGFEKYLIFYLPTTTGVRILHILHSATDCGRIFDDER